jgi:hypothetical protein
VTSAPLRDVPALVWGLVDRPQVRSLRALLLRRRRTLLAVALAVGIAAMVLHWS